MSFQPKAREVFDVELAALQAVKAQIDDRFDTAIDWITSALRSRSKIIVAGVGKSGNIGHKIAATFTSTGTTAIVLSPVDALHGDLGIVTDGDIVLTLSYSGETEELIQLLPALKRFAVKIIAMTAAPKSTLARHADLVLPCKVPKEACPFNLAPTSSTTAMMALGDALAMAVLEARGFKRQDFAKYHPSGAIGRALLLQVGDIMRSGPRNAVAPESTVVREALLLMTKAKSGSVSVTHPKGKLVGVFTDGDLRRGMAKDPHFLEKSLREVMTPNPVTIRESALAIEAIQIFNQRSIDDLIVVNAKNQPVGLVDTQDLPRLKLM